MGLFSQTGTKSTRMASAQGGSVLGLQQVLEEILVEQRKQTALLERVANPIPVPRIGRYSVRQPEPSWAGTVTGSPPPNS